MRLNAILVIPVEIEIAAIDLSKRIGSEYAAHFILGREQCRSHITLYSPEYPKSAREGVIAAVERIAVNTAAISCTFVEASSEEGYVGLEMELTPQIRQLHEELVVGLNSLRGGHVREKYASDYHVRFSDEQIKNIEAYGFPNAMSLYHPHLTLTRLKDEQKAKEAAQELEWPRTEFLVESMAVYEMGEHGTCQKLVRRFSLKK